MRRVIAVAAGLVDAAVAIPNLVVWLGGRSPVTSDRAKVPNGQPSAMLADGIPGADVVTGAGPRFLGAQIPITGDGRRSWGP